MGKLLQLALISYLYNPWEKSLTDDEYLSFLLINLQMLKLAQFGLNID